MKRLKITIALPWMCLCVYIVHVLKIFYPVSRCLKYPLAMYDYGFHFVEGIRGYNALKANGRFWSYNTDFSGGYPEGVYLGISSRLFACFNVLTEWLDANIVYNTSVFVIITALPFIAYVAARRFSFSSSRSQLFATLNMIVLVSHEMFYEFVMIGHLGFLLGTYLILWCSAELMRYIDYRRSSSLILFCFLAMLSMIVHALMPIMLLVCSFSIVFFKIRKIDVKSFMTIAIVALISILPNLLWLVPLINFVGIKLSWSQFLQSDSSNLYRVLFNIMNWIILAGLIVSFIRRKIGDLHKIFFIPLVVCLILLFIGSQLGFGDIQPARFLIPGIIIALLLVSTQRTVVVMSVACILLYIAFIQYKPLGLRCGFRGQEKADKLVSFVKKNILDDSRIAFQNDRELRCFDSRFALMFQHLTQKKFSTGVFTFPPTTFSFSQFHNKTIFNQPIDEIEKVLPYLHLYNVKYLVVNDQEAKRVFWESPLFKVIFTVGDIMIFEYHRLVSSFCYKCSADIEVGDNKLHVQAYDQKNIIIKYHYIDGMSSVPSSINVHPIKLLDDPNPFILIKDISTSSFEILFP